MAIDFGGELIVEGRTVSMTSMVHDGRRNAVSSCCCESLRVGDVAYYCRDRGWQTGLEQRLQIAAPAGNEHDYSLLTHGYMIESTLFACRCASDLRVCGDHRNLSAQPP